MRKTYTTRGMRSTGRKSLFFGEKAESRYYGGGFTVTYSIRQKSKRDVLHVSIELEGHDVIGSWITISSSPSIEAAQVAANAAFRTHFGIWNGDAHEHAGRVLEFCKCKHEQPRQEYKGAVRPVKLTRAKRS